MALNRYNQGPTSKSQLRAKWYESFWYTTIHLLFN